MYDLENMLPAMEEAIQQDPRLSRDPRLATYPPWYKRLMRNTLAQMAGTETVVPRDPDAADPWNPVQTYTNLGKIAGGLIRAFQHGGTAGRYGPELALLGEGGEEEYIIPRSKWMELAAAGVVPPGPPVSPAGPPPPAALPGPPSVAPPSLPASTPPIAGPPGNLGTRPAGPAVQAYQQKLQQGPPPAPKVPWWQEVLARVPAAAAGYVNAAGRSRVPMPSTDPVKMFHPGYGRKMEEYGQQLTLGKEAAGLEREQDKMDLAREQAEAAMDTSRATKALRERQAAALDQPKPSKGAETAEVIEAKYKTGLKLGLSPEEARKSALGIPRDPTEKSLVFKEQVDDVTGDWTVQAFDPMTGKPVGEPFQMKGVARPKPTKETSGPSGSFTALTNEAGEVTEFFNPTTGERVPAPVAGARKTGIPPAERTKRATMGEMIESLQQLRSLGEKHKGKIGFVSGRATDIARKTVGLSGDVNDLFQISDNLADQLLRARSGAQINEREYARLRNLVPNPRDPYDKFVSDLNRFDAELKGIQSRVQSSVQPGQTGQPEQPVLMKSPKGNTGYVPPSEVEAAKSRGWVEVTPNAGATR